MDEDAEFQNRIQLIADLIGDNFLRLARQLRELQDLDQEMADNKRRFLTVVEKLEIGSRKAYALAQLSRTFHGKGVSEERLQTIGWSKLTIISRHLTKGNVEALLDLAEANTAHTLQMLLRGADPIANARVLVLYIDPTDYKRLRKALLHHGAKPSAKGMTAVESALMQLVGAAGF